MSNDNPNNHASTASATVVTPTINRAERLNSLLNRAVAPSAGASVVRVAEQPAQLSYQSATGMFTNRDTGETFHESTVPHVLPGENGELISDDGRSVEAEMAKLSTDWQKRADVLAEVRFDQRTGEKRYVVEGPQREKMMREFQDFHASMQDEVVILNRLKEQRVRQKAEQAQSFQQSLDREAELDRRALEIADEREAQQRADRILAERRRG